MRAPFLGLLLFSPEMLALERLLPWLPCALPWTAFRAQIWRSRSRRSALRRFITGCHCCHDSELWVAISVMAHQAVKPIETRVQPANWDGQMPWTMVILPAGSQTNDAQLSSGDVVVMVARGDIR